MIACLTTIQPGAIVPSATKSAPHRILRIGRTMPPAGLNSPSRNVASWARISTATARRPGPGVHRADLAPAILAIARNPAGAPSRSLAVSWRASWASCGGLHATTCHRQPSAACGRGARGAWECVVAGTAVPRSESPLPGIPGNLPGNSKIQARILGASLHYRCHCQGRPHSPSRVIVGSPLTITTRYRVP